MDRNRQRASNYAQTSVYPFKGRYADWEDELVLEHTIPDRTLSSMLQRSVVSIQMRRSRLKKILERNESFEAEEDEPQTEREGE